jgi:putative ABC transport system permease protein
MTRSEASGILAMSLRNLSRHRAKTAVTVAAVAISVSMYIFVDGWIYGMNLDSRRNIVSYEMGAAKVQSDAYYAKKDDRPMYEAFSGWEEGARRLEAAGYAVAPRFVFIGTAHSSSGSAPVVVNAVDPDRESAVLRYPGYVEVGRFPRGGTMEMAVGSMLAERLHVGIPQRPTASEYERELLAAARDDGEARLLSRSTSHIAPKRRRGGPSRTARPTATRKTA